MSYSIHKNVSQEIIGGIVFLTQKRDADGKPYTVRNRVTLCRCGKSGNKPFCDGSHVER
ncbi:MAG: CDGSH iron-sulfur domain-containing protein [Methanoregula sp.]